MNLIGAANLAVEKSLLSLNLVLDAFNGLEVLDCLHVEFYKGKEVIC